MLRHHWDASYRHTAVVQGDFKAVVRIRSLSMYMADITLKSRYFRRLMFCELTFKWTLRLRSLLRSDLRSCLR